MGIHWRVRTLIETARLYRLYPSLIRLDSGFSDDRDALHSAMRWLCRAQDVTNCGGVSAYYSIEYGKWALPYRETTGYIIPTFLKYGDLTGEDEYKARAMAMGDWEITEQGSDGSVSDVFYESNTPDVPCEGMAPSVKVFNTGQVILGWSRLFEATGETRYLDAARRAGDWLANVQDTDGGWRRFAPEGANGIHAHVSWPLLELARASGEDSYRQVAEKNIDWILKQQNEVGWFANSSLEPGQNPWTHAIGYTIGGLSECCLFLKARKDLLMAVVKGGGALLAFYNAEVPARFPSLPRRLDSRWTSSDSDSCLTGNAQIAILWMRLYRMTGEEGCRNAARRIVDQMKTTQRRFSLNRNIIGGIAGSDPIDSGYSRLRILNWATKFYADALMLLMCDRDAHEAQ